MNRSILPFLLLLTVITVVVGTSISQYLSLLLLLSQNHMLQNKDFPCKLFSFDTNHILLMFYSFQIYQHKCLHYFVWPMDLVCNVAELSAGFLKFVYGCSFHKNRMSAYKSTTWPFHYSDTYPLI